MRAIDVVAPPAERPIPTVPPAPAAAPSRAWWLPVLVVALAATWAAVAQPWQEPGDPIRSDGSGYHAWTRALVTGDLSFCGDPELEAVLAISVRDEERGVCQNKYPPGMALLRLPVMGLLVDRDGGGTTDAEHLANRWLGVITLVATVALVADAVRRLGVRPLPAAVAVLTATFGTGLFHYATFDASFSHGTSALLVAALCWVGVRAAGRSAPPPPVATALLVLAATLTRNPNVLVIAALAVGWLVWRRVPPTDLRRLARHLGPVAAGVLVGMALQLAYNRWATGGWALSSYGAEPFLLDRPRQHSVLLSYERGLLTWYPVVGVGIVALFASRRGRGLAAWAVLLILPLVVLYGFWSSWSLGGGFGHRGFVELAPALAVLFAVGLDRLGPRGRWCAAAAMVAATVVTVSLMAGYWRGSVPFLGTRADVYWAHVVGDEALHLP